jgi:hypothetical protein
MSDESLAPIGQWLGQSFARLKGSLLTLSIIFIIGFVTVTLGCVLVYALGVVSFGFIQGWGNVMAMVTNPSRLQAFGEQNQSLIFIVNLLAWLVGLRMFCWATLAAIHAASDESLGVRAAFKAGKSRGYGFLALFVILQIILMIGIMLLILPGLILAVLLGFTLWVFARENAGMLASLGRSVKLVKGHFLGVLGRMILVGLIGALIMIIPIIGWLVAPAFMMLAWSTLYMQLSDAVPAPVAGVEALFEDEPPPEPEPLPKPEPTPEPGELPAIVPSSALVKVTADTRVPMGVFVLGLILFIGSVVVSLFM